MARHAAPRALSLLVSISLLGSCSTTLEPEASVLVRVQPGPSTRLDHALWGRVLRKFGDADGRLDYTSLIDDRADFDRLYAQVALASPDSAPELYPTPKDRLAYWIDAFNIAAVHNVLAHYPIRSIRDVPGPLLLPGFLTEDGAGFLRFRELVFGGESIDLATLENDLVAERFRDPRIHFVLNRASLGGPRLRLRPFGPENLDAVLQRATVEFFAEPRNLRFDPVTNTVTMSGILDQYRDDFTIWLERMHPESPPSLIEYAARYSMSSMAVLLRGSENPTVVFEPYDWRLNDRRD